MRKATPRMGTVGQRAVQAFTRLHPVVAAPVGYVEVYQAQALRRGRGVALLQVRVGEEGREFLIEAMSCRLITLTL